jgi:hypothetical protein
MKLQFTCKDPVLSTYYERKFGEHFAATAQLWPQLSEIERVGIKAGWDLAMLREARRQEHYDYITDTNEHGQKIHVLLEPKKLLIPQIEVQE